MLSPHTVVSLTEKVCTVISAAIISQITTNPGTFFPPLYKALNRLAALVAKVRISLFRTSQSDIETTKPTRRETPRKENDKASSLFGDI